MVLQYSIQPLRGFKEYREIQQTGPLSGLQIHTFVLKLVLPPVFSFAEKTKPMRIITLYQSQRELFWWNWKINLLTREATVPLDGESIRNGLLGNRWSVQPSERQITCFTCFTSKMYILTSSEAWKSYEDAYKSVISSLEEEAQNILDDHKGRIGMMAHHVSARPDFLNFVKNEQLSSSDKEYKYKVIDLNKYITDPHFYHTKCIGSPIPKTKITARKNEAKWFVELEGASKKTATFILDENYEVLDVFGKAVEGPFIYVHK